MCCPACRGSGGLTTWRVLAPPLHGRFPRPMFGICIPSSISSSMARSLARHRAIRSSFGRCTKWGPLRGGATIPRTAAGLSKAAESASICRPAMTPGMPLIKFGKQRRRFMIACPPNSWPSWLQAGGWRGARRIAACLPGTRYTSSPTVLTWIPSALMTGPSQGGCSAFRTLRVFCCTFPNLIE